MTTTTTPTHFDAIVIGTGFGGIYMLHKLRNELGLRVRAFDRAGGVGGTWYWNRYPGAASDLDSIVYRYSFDKEMLQEWNWKTRYATQPEMRAYLDAVVDRHDLRGDIQLDTGIASMAFDEETDRWAVRTDGGEEFTARYVASALGPLSAPNIPELEGIDDFAGRVVHTGSWPADLDVTGKRVGVFGTGSTGTQFICAAAKTVEHLTVFQRSAQYVVPSGARPLTEEYLADVRANYGRIWEQAFASQWACNFRESTTPAMSLSEEDRQRVFQQAWDAGSGFQFMFGTFCDIGFDPAANEAAAAFIKAKIRQIVRDPETARKLTPTDLYAKRPVSNDGYYETYNRPNVTLVSTKETPVERITPTGVVTSDGVEHELDVLVFATGYEAIEGPYNRIDVRGRGGVTLAEHWSGAPSSYLGIGMNGFPNLFMVLGPNTVFCNVPPALETQVEWISELIESAERRGVTRVEATAAAEREWTVMCKEMAEHSLFAQTPSWIFGTNIPGRERRTLLYFGGLAAYRQKLAEITAADYAGFTLHREPVSTPA